jgi:hypothetical protein
MILSPPTGVNAKNAANHRQTYAKSFTGTSSHGTMRGLSEQAFIGPGVTSLQTAQYP